MGVTTTLTVIACFLQMKKCGMSKGLWNANLEGVLSQEMVVFSYRGHEDTRRLWHGKDDF